MTNVSNSCLSGSKIDSVCASNETRNTRVTNSPSRFTTFPTTTRDGPNCAGMLFFTAGRSSVAIGFCFGRVLPMSSVEGVRLAM
ncbi:hypothetical protein D3C83_45090 [compost metagenome]